MLARTQLGVILGVLVASTPVARAQDPGPRPSVVLSIASSSEETRIALRAHLGDVVRLDEVDRTEGSTAASALEASQLLELARARGAIAALGVHPDETPPHLVAVDPRSGDSLLRSVDAEPRSADGIESLALVARSIVDALASGGSITVAPAPAPAVAPVVEPTLAGEPAEPIVVSARGTWASAMIADGPVLGTGLAIDLGLAPIDALRFELGYGWLAPIEITREGGTVALERHRARALAAWVSRFEPLAIAVDVGAALEWTLRRTLALDGVPAPDAAHVGVALLAALELAVALVRPLELLVRAGVEIPTERVRQRIAGTGDPVFFDPWPVRVVAELGARVSFR